MGGGDTIGRAQGENSIGRATVVVQYHEPPEGVGKSGVEIYIGRYHNLLRGWDRASKLHWVGIVNIRFSICQQT